MGGNGGTKTSYTTVSSLMKGHFYLYSLVISIGPLIVLITCLYSDSLLDFIVSKTYQLRTVQFLLSS